MKKIFSIAAAALLFVACSPKEFNLSTKTQSLDLPETAVTDSLVVNGSDGNCELEYAPQWIQTEMHDSVVVYKVQPNSTGKARKDAIVVKCGNSTLSIPVRQYAKATKLELPDAKDVTLPREGGSEELVVVCDGIVKVEGFEGVEATYSNGKLTIKASKNEGNRFNGEVRLSAGDLEKTVKVTVDGKVCATCKGTGKVRCKVCGGSGETMRDPWSINGCRTCGGKGWADRVSDYNYRRGSGKIPCPTCGGKGV